MDAKPSIVQFESQNFFRTLDWRWRRAQRIVESNQPIPASRDDSDTIIASRCLRALGRCRTAKERASVKKKWPAIHAANLAAEKDGPNLWEIKARILAGQTDKEIGAHCALAPAVIRWFESLYFCIRDRLQATDWIAKVIGPGLQRGFKSEEKGQIWMALAYHGGPLVLDVVMAVTSADFGRNRRKTKDYPAACRDGADLLVKAMMIPADAPLHRIADLCASVRRIERSAKLKRNPTTTSRQTENILIAATPFDLQQ